ncbi:MAG: triose-phosphate isomerase [Limnochordia bacterium]|jgi:triosephosphate isomerase
MRRPLIAANWKMFKTIKETEEFCHAFLAQEKTEAEVVICPPFTALAAAAAALDGSEVKLGAQDIYWEKEGAFTGEIAPPMLVELGCKYVIVGHSERRGYFGETDEIVNRKARAVLAYGMSPIICLGETLEQREAGQTEALVVSQVEAAYKDISPAEAQRTVIAYEPIWAIGTGRNATATDANQVIGVIRDTLRKLYGDVADGIRIQYGGSVKPGNIAEFMEQPEIDGALVGGASLNPDDFGVIARLGR